MTTPSPGPEHAHPELPHRERPARDAASTATSAVLALISGAAVWFVLPMAIPDLPAWLRFALGVAAAASSAIADPRPRIVVTDGYIRAGWRRIPLADVHAVDRDRREHRLEADAATPPRVRFRVGTVLARDGVRVDACTPEGLPYDIWIASADPDGLAAVIAGASAASAAHEQGAATSQVDTPAGYRGPRGAIWGLAVPFVVIGSAITWWVATGVGVAARLATITVLVALVAVPASRPVEVSERRVRSGHVDVTADRIVAARLAGRGELLPHWQQLPRRNRAISVWGPSNVVVFVTEPPGERAEERLGATHMVALPRPVELHALLPAEVVGRRLPPVDPVP